MIGFSLLLYVQRVTGSYAKAGIVSAAVLIGVALGSIVQSRTMDRVGPSRPLVAATTIFATFVTVIIVAIEHGATIVTLVPIALCIGVTQPTIGAASRAMWTRLLPPGPTRNAALTYEAIITEVYFVVGPALSGLLVTAPWPGTGVIVGAAFMVVGTVWYALTPTMRRHRPAERQRPTRRLLGALASPGLRTVALASLGMGVILGFVEVTVPSAATKAGHVAAGGLLIGLWSISSAIFGIFYGIRPWPRTVRLRIPVLLGGFALLVLPLTIPTSLPWLAVPLLFAGTLITPQTAAHAESVDGVALNGLITESFGWVITAATLGIGFGHAVSGQVIEQAGISASYLTAAVIGATLAFVVYLRRNTLGDPDRAAKPLSV
jgi:MFS family permease